MVNKAISTSGLLGPSRCELNQVRVDVKIVVFSAEAARTVIWTRGSRCQCLHRDEAMWYSDHESVNQIIVAPANTEA